MAGTVFIFGLGYVGRPLGHRLAAAGWQVRGTTRNPSRLAAQAEAGWQIHEFADDRPLADPEAALEGVDALITTITAIGGSDPVLDAHGELIEDFKGWSGYVSATSVYPDTPDGFCYEDTPTGPATARGRARVKAAQRWLDLLGTELFRRVIEAAMAQPRRGRIINLADKKPAPQGDVVRHAAGLIGVEPPQPQSLEEANLSPMARSFYVSRRKVASKVIGPELGLDLLYPDYESGLAAILKAETPS